MAKRTRNNRHNIVWLYARQCWSALKNGESVPSVPYYDIWETDDSGSNGPVLIDKKLIEPCKLVCDGISYF